MEGGFRWGRGEVGRGRMALTTYLLTFKLATRTRSKNVSPSVLGGVRDDCRGATTSGTLEGTVKIADVGRLTLGRRGRGTLGAGFSVGIRSGNVASRRSSNHY